MKRFFFILLFLLIFSHQAKAQLLPGAQNFGQICPGAGALCDQPASCSYSPPLDSQPAQAAYSFRLLSTAFVGKNIVRIRRSSDSTTKDFQVTFPTCTINQNDAFFDGSNYSVAIWYDQSGNGLNLTQSTVSHQPTVTLNCQNGQPCGVYTSANGTNFTTTLPSSIGDLTLSVVAKTKTSGGEIASIGQTVFVNNYSGIGYSGTTSCYANTSTCSGGPCGVTVSATCAQNTWYAWTGTFSVSQTYVDLNGNTNTGASSIGGGSGFEVGGVVAVNTNWNGDISELILYNPSISTTISANVLANQRTFWNF